MSDGEHTLVDASGDFLYVVRDGEAVADPSWQSCRIVLTDERLVLSTNDGERAISLGNLSPVEDPAAVVPDGVSAGNATPLRAGDAVVLLDAGAVEDFETEYARAVLHDEIVLARPTAVVGGADREDAEWSKARLRFQEDRLLIGLPGGETASLDLADVGGFERSRSTVLEAERPVLAVEHSDAEDRAVESQFSGTERHVGALATVLEDAAATREEAVELTETEREVLMALYSGVSPFEMADFVGVDVEEIERVYGGLLEAGAVEKVRERTEVTLNERGRNLASEAMNEP